MELFGIRFHKKTAFCVKMNLALLYVLKIYAVFHSINQ